MEDGAQLVVLEREEHEIPWGFSVVPCPDGVARITQVEPESLAEEFGLRDGDRVLQVGRMKVDPRDGLNLNNINMLLRMPTPQLEIVVLRDDFLDRNLGPSIPKRRLQDFHPLPRNQSEDNESADEDEEEIVPSVPVKALSEYWEHPDQEGFEPTRPKPGFLPPEKTEVGEWHQREAARRQERYEQERRQNEELERQRIAEDRKNRMSEPENVRTVEETLPDGTKIIRRIITKKAGSAPVAVPDGDREVQEFEDTLPDGTKVIRRVIRTKRPSQQLVQQQQNDENVSIRQVEETLPDGTKVLRTYRTVKKQVQQQNSEQGDGDQQRQTVQLNEQQLRQIQESTRQQPGGQQTTVQRIQQTQQMQRVEHVQQTQQIQQQRTEHIQQIERREVRQVTQEVQEHHQQRQIEEHTRIVQQQEHQQQFQQIQQQETTQQKKPQPTKNRSPPPRNRSPPPRPLQTAPEPQRPKPKSRSPPPRPLNQAPEPRQPQPRPQPQQQAPRQVDPPTPQAPSPKPEQQIPPQPVAPPRQQAMQKPPPTPKTQRKVDRNWEEQQRREFEEYLRQREEQGPPPQGPKSNADYVSKYQEQLLKRRPSQGGHQPGSIEDYRKQYEESLRRGSGPIAPPPPGANTEYIRMYEETLKKKEEIDRQRAEDRFERGQARTQEEYKRFYEEELRRKQTLEQEQEEERRRYLEEQSKQREHISRSKELYTQQLQKDMQKKEHLVTRPTELRPERVGSQASHWEKIADNERAKMNPQVPPSPKIQRKNLDACWPPKREDGVLVRPAFSRENSFHGSSRKVYQWPPPRASSMDRERPSTPMGELKHDIQWNQQELERERMTTPPPFARSPQVGRRKVVWPPPSPTTEQTPFFEPGQRRGSQTASLEEYLASQQSPQHIPATYRPPPGTSHYEDQSF